MTPPWANCPALFDHWAQGHEVGLEGRGPLAVALRCFTCHKDLMILGRPLVNSAKPELQAAVRKAMEEVIGAHFTEYDDGSLVADLGSDELAPGEFELTVCSDGSVVLHRFEEHWSGPREGESPAAYGKRVAEQLKTWGMQL